MLLPLGLYTLTNSDGFAFSVAIVIAATLLNGRAIGVIRAGAIMLLLVYITAHGVYCSSRLAQRVSMHGAGGMFCGILTSIVLGALG